MIYFYKGTRSQKVSTAILSETLDKLPDLNTCAVRAGLVFGSARHKSERASRPAHNRLNRPSPRASGQDAEGCGAAQRRRWRCRSFSTMLRHRLGVAPCQPRRALRHLSVANSGTAVQFRWCTTWPTSLSSPTGEGGVWRKSNRCWTASSTFCFLSFVSD